MGDRHIPIIDEDKLDDIITALQNLSAPSGTDVAISPTGMHIVTEDDVQGAISELDAKAYEINSSLTQKVNVVTLSARVEVTYADTSTIGYRTTETTKVDITQLTGYPTGKTVVANIAYGTENFGDIAWVDNSNYLRMASKTSGTKGAKVVVMYY